MIFRLIELLKCTLKVCEHLLDLLLSPSIFSLEIINGVFTAAQDCFERVCFINFLHIIPPHCYYLLFERL